MNSKPIFLTVISFLLITFFGCKQARDESEIDESTRWEQRAANVEIIRDEFGVPHIYGKTDADAVFGFLFAQCEDDFNRVERNYIWATGRLAELEGEEALYSDLRTQLYMTKEEAIAYYDNSPEWLQELCVAFADGVNYYLETHPEVTPKIITHFEPWMPMCFSEGSIGGDIERVSTKKIQEFYGNEGDQNLAIHNGLIRLEDDEPRGSNGLALSGKLTESGNAMLLINPHTSFFFRGEAHIVSEEGLNAYGAFTWGQFFIYQGFNEKTGWMHTSTGTDIIDEFAETIAKSEDGLNYKYGDELRPVDSLTISLNYLGSDNIIGSKNFKIYRTHHGPITHSEGDKWIATALMWSPTDALIQSYTRIKQSSHEGFDKMMEIRTNSSNNTVYADADGTIAYYHGNFIPKRDTVFDYTKPVDGSNPATDWQGLHDLKDNIFVLNPENGWIQNCNSTPFTSALEYSPKEENYPNYMTSFPENYRGVHAIDLLSNTEPVTLDGLIELAYDPYLPGAKVLVDGIIKAYEISSEADAKISEAVGVLKAWDYKVSAESKAMSIAHYYLMTYRRSNKIPTAVRFPMATIEYISIDSEVEERLEQFEMALSKLESDFGSIQVPWGEINRYQRNTGDIKQNFDDNKPSVPVGMASSYWGALASYGARAGDNTKRIYGVAGNSFVAAVEFGEKLKAKTILAGGQSGDPKSPHFDDQVERYVNADFKDVAFYKEDVVSRGVATYHPGKR